MLVCKRAGSLKKGDWGESLPSANVVPGCQVKKKKALKSYIVHEMATPASTTDASYSHLISATFDIKRRRPSLCGQESGILWNVERAKQHQHMRLLSLHD